MDDMNEWKTPCSSNIGIFSSIHIPRTFLNLTNLVSVLIVVGNLFQWRDPLKAKEFLYKLSLVFFIAICTICMVIPAQHFSTVFWLLCFPFPIHCDQCVVRNKLPASQSCLTLDLYWFLEETEGKSVQPCSAWLGEH